MSYYIGLDIGGTSVKGAIFKDTTPIYETSVPTLLGDEFIGCLERLAVALVQGCGAVFSEVKGVGVGCPGLIDSGNGIVVYAANLNLKDFPLQKLLEERLNLPVKISNDANTAALGEAKFGAGMGYGSSVLVTLGTGVGGGIVLNGKLFEGYKSAGAELGHMVIEHGGERCTCGRYGCFEAYSSARALTKRVRKAMEEDTSSEMWKTYTNETADARTPFEYMVTDPTAKQVMDWYFKYLACGLTNLANIFRPEVIMIGGGVAAQGTRLTVPLQQLVNKELFAGTDYAPVEVRPAALGPKAGSYGAAALVME